MSEDLDELGRVIAYLNHEDIPYLLVGKGSNLLVKDNGIDGLVILLKGSLATVDKNIEDGTTILAGAGLPLVDLLIFCRMQGLTGLEWLAGIPGTVGGAIVMNAGAFGNELEANVDELQMITPQGRWATRRRSQLRFSYRRLEMENRSVIVRVKFNLEKSTEKTVSQNILEYLKRRKMNQPLEYPSAGSVFKNPPHEYAGKLMEKAGLKGKRIGGAMISEKHANFILNIGGATARDILNLISLARAEVQKTTGIELELEIHVVGK